MKAMLEAAISDLGTLALKLQLDYKLFARKKKKSSLFIILPSFSGPLSLISVKFLSFNLYCLSKLWSRSYLPFFNVIFLILGLGNCPHLLHTQAALFWRFNTNVERSCAPVISDGQKMLKCETAKHWLG